MFSCASSLTNPVKKFGGGVPRKAVLRPGAAAESEKTSQGKKEEVLVFPARSVPAIKSKKRVAAFMI